MSGYTEPNWERMSGYTEPNWESSALVVIDLQRDFIEGGASPISGTGAIVPHVAALAAGFRAAGRPIAHIVRLYEPGGSDVDLPRREAVENGTRIVAPGSDGAQIPQEVLAHADRLDDDLLLAGKAQQLGEREVVFFKPRWSAFHRTGLEDWLRGQECDTVLVAGCNLPNCLRATLFDASERDFRTALAKDAVSQASDERLADLERIGVRLLTTAEVLAEIGT
jgi:nicotinamidase-related amidase